jgi:hypothetical protein
MKTFQEFITEAKKCWPGYKKKGTKKLFGKTYNNCVKEGKVEWDNPKRPLQSGLTPREKNRAKRISTGVENPDRIPSERDLERYGKLKIAHDDEKGKKVSRGKRHEFKIITNWEGNQLETEGQQARAFKDHKNIKNLKEPKESFEYELEESSTGERSRGRATLGRAGNKMDRGERSVAAIAKKAGLKGTGKYSTKDLRTRAKDYTTYDSDDDMDDIGSTKQDHFIRTYSSARKAAKAERLITKIKPAGRNASGMTKLKTAPSSESVRRVKDLKKQMTKSGASKTGKVHTVDIMHRDGDVGKGDRNQRMERGRNFIQAIKDTPKQLKKAGAKKGDTVIGKPTAVMPGEDKKTGEAKRAKLYGKIFGKKSTKASPKTGLMVGKVD